MLSRCNVPNFTSFRLMTVPSLTFPSAVRNRCFPTTSDEDKYPFFTINVASTEERETSEAPVSKMKCKGKPLIVHFTLHKSPSFTKGISSICSTYNVESSSSVTVSCMCFCLYFSINALYASSLRMLFKSRSRSICANLLKPSSNALRK